MKNELGLYEKKTGKFTGNVFASSLDIARYFEKRHDSIISTIEALEAETKGCTFQMETPIFIKGEYQNEQNNQMYTKYDINKRAFVLLMMRLKGKVAFIMQNKYIDNFEFMEAFIREKQSADWKTARINGKATRKHETDAIRDKLIPLAIEQGSKNYMKFYLTYSKLINSLLNINSDMRNELPYRYLATIEMLENIIENIIISEVDKGTHYKEIYQVVKIKCNIAVELSFLPKLNLLKTIDRVK